MSHDNAIVITTAPSERQVKELLWREIRQLYMPHRAVIGGKLTRTRLDFAPNRYAYGFSTNTEDRFQGFHSGNILVIVDEASGVDEYIFNAIEGVTTADNSKLLLIGNPHGYAGTFYDAFHKNRKQFHTVHISAFDTPAFTNAGITAENIADIEYPDPSPSFPRTPTSFPRRREPRTLGQMGAGHHSPSAKICVIRGSDDKSLDKYHSVVLASEMYTHLVPDRRIRATIKSRLDERNKDQYVDGN